MADDGPSTDKQTDKPIRVALLASKENLRTGVTALRGLLDRLAELKWPTLLLVPHGPAADAVSPDAVEKVEYPFLNVPLTARYNRKLLMERLEQFKPDVIHCLSARRAKLGGMAAKELEVPYLLSFPRAAGALRPRVHEKYCAALIGSSKTVTDGLVKTYTKLADRIRQIAPGIEVEDTCACFSSGAQVTSLVVAQPMKHADEFEPLLNAVKHLAIDGYKLILAVIGKGPWERRLHKAVKGMQLGQIVTVVPEIPYLREVLANADIFVQPRLSRGHNPHLLEAMSVGMAIAACKGDPDELLRPDETAVFFDAKDELNIYSTLQRLLDKREFARQIGMNGQSLLRRERTIGRMSSQLIDAYRSAVHFTTRP